VVRQGGGGGARRDGVDRRRRNESSSLRERVGLEYAVLLQDPEQ
jgi:hypothetical protein